MVYTRLTSGSEAIIHYNSGSSLPDAQVCIPLQYSGKNETVRPHVPKKSIKDDPIASQNTRHRATYIMHDLVGLK